MFDKIDKLVEKYGLVPALGPKGQPAVRVLHGRPTPDEVSFIRANKMAILTRIREREAEKRAAEEAARQERIRRIREDEELIRLRWYEGDILQDWMVVGYDAAKLLEELGIADYISGWGYRIRPCAVDALGTEFTYSQALEYARSLVKAREAKKAAKEAERAAKFKEARETGKPVLLRQWSEPCSDPREECSLDIASEWALPDGTTKTTREHTW